MFMSFVVLTYSPHRRIQKEVFGGETGACSGICTDADISLEKSLNYNR